MIEQQGRVISRPGLPLCVQIGVQTGCSACDAGEGCGAGLFGRLLKRSPLDLELPDTHSFRPGQAVMVGIPEQQFLGWIFRLYAIPLLAAVLGAMAGHQVATTQLASAGWVDLAALAGGVLAGALGLRLVSPKPLAVQSLNLQFEAVDRVCPSLELFGQQTHKE